MAPISSFKDLIVWQKAFRLCTGIYGETRGFPADERFGLVAELRKTARSVVCNIAEGHRKRSTAEFLRFLDISAGSSAEVETQLLLARELDYLGAEQSEALLVLLAEVQRMLRSLIRSLRAKP